MELQLITSSEAEFKINGKTQLTSKGILNIATGKKNRESN